MVRAIDQLAFVVPVNVEENLVVEEEPDHLHPTAVQTDGLGRKFLERLAFVVGETDFPTLMSENELLKHIAVVQSSDLIEVMGNLLHYVGVVVIECQSGVQSRSHHYDVDGLDQEGVVILVDLRQNLFISVDFLDFYFPPLHLEFR